MGNSHKNIKLLGWFNFLLDFRVYTPVLILYFTKVTGSFALAMSIFATTQLASAALELPTGIFSDMIGRRRTVIVGAVATVVSVILYAVGGTYWVLLSGAIMEGLGRSFYSGNNDALLHDSLAEDKKEEYGEHKGKTDAGSLIAIAITAILGGVIAYYSYALVMWLSVIPAVLGLIVSTMLVEPEQSSRIETNVYAHLLAAIHQFRVNNKLRWLTMGSIIGYGQGEAGYNFRAAFNQMLWPVWAIGLAQAIGSLGAAASFYYSGKLIKKFGELRLVLIGKGYAHLSNIVATIYPTVLSPLILCSNSFLFGSTSTASSALKQREYTPTQRATMASLDALGGSVFYAMVAVLLGLVADTWSPAKALLSLQLLAFISTYATWHLYRKERMG